MEDLSIYDDGKLGSIRNPDGIWVNVAPFREAAMDFAKQGCYTADPWGSPAWYEYWMEQRRRCIEGYTVGGASITGEHYMYLNFVQIKMSVKGAGKKSRKITSFPDFWDGDYNYFWVRQIAKEGVLSLEKDEEKASFISNLPDIEAVPYLKNLYDGLGLNVSIPTHREIKLSSGVLVRNYLNGGFNMIIGKSRRKGYSYKSAAVGCCNYYTKPDSYTIYGAYEKKYLYPKGIFSMCRNNISFINSNTGWTMPNDSINRQDHIRASYKEVVNGVEIERGFMSEIQALTFKDNPDAARGRDSEDIFFEESGAFGVPGLLKDSYSATEDCVKDGMVKTGMITLFGTSGDMEGGTADYSEMYNSPDRFDFLPFYNIWDKNSEKQLVGFFHPMSLNLPGFYDEQGNSDTKGAVSAIINERELMVKNGATSTDIAKKKQENPLGPAEAFSIIGTNMFPVVEISSQLQKVKANKWQETKGSPVELYYDKGKVQVKTILDARKSPITTFLGEPVDKQGCPIIYEMPIPGSPKGLYKIGYDPVRQDDGTSLTSIVAVKGVHMGTYTHNNIVFEYIGRTKVNEDNDRLAEMVSDLYNSPIMHENEVTSVKNYFRRIKKLHMLSLQPDAVISKNIKKSRTSRVYGCHMVAQLKDAGERYLADWLLMKVDTDENGDPVRVIDRIYSIRFLEELLAYRRSGNFDYISAMFMCMFQVQEDEIGTTYDTAPEEEKMDRLMGLMNEMYV